MEPNPSKMNSGQKEVDHLIKEVWKKDYFSHLSIVAQISEEAGEVAGVVNRLHGEQKPKPGDELNLEKEIGDLLFSLCCLANKTGINLDEALDKMIAEKSGRDKKRFD